MSFIYLHNPRCSKSRQGLELIEQAGVPVQIREYLKQPLTATELAELFTKLGDQVDQVVRTKEQEYQTLKESGRWPQERDLSQWAQILAEHPKLLERPILLDDTRAVIGRPPEELQKLLKS